MHSSSPSYVAILDTAPESGPAQRLMSLPFANRIVNHRSSHALFKFSRSNLGSTLSAERRKVQSRML